MLNHYAVGGFENYNNVNNILSVAECPMLHMASLILDLRFPLCGALHCAV